MKFNDGVWVIKESRIGSRADTSLIFCRSFAAYPLGNNIPELNGSFLEVRAIIILLTADTSCWVTTRAFPFHVTITAGPNVYNYHVGILTHDLLFVPIFALSSPVTRLSLQDLTVSYVDGSCCM